MKVRFGFVANSSSQDFVLHNRRMTQSKHSIDVEHNLGDLKSPVLKRLLLEDIPEEVKVVILKEFENRKGKSDDGYDDSPVEVVVVERSMCYDSHGQETFEEEVIYSYQEII